jgi:hypothetical protein
MGRVKREWQNRDTVLAYFGKRKKERLKNIQNLLEKELKPVVARNWWEEVLFAVLGDGHRFFPKPPLESGKTN